MIIGTAGHIDHGKTALVRALTGVDTDRLSEEKRRGITIDLGFAPLVLPGIGTVGVVDVPGHDAFVRTMVAGATGIDIALLVISADEGAMPQTREHLAILGLLGVTHAVVALTKADLVDRDWIELLSADIEGLLAGTSLAGAPRIPVSAITGEGVDALRAALSAAATGVAARVGADVMRLPVDRVFSVAGSGTVVTGTLWSGCLAIGDDVTLLPSGASARVRGLQTHGVPTERADPGTRVAVALAGVKREDVDRGDVLVGDESWRATAMLRADVTLLPDAPAPLTARSRVRFHLGTTRVRFHLGTTDVGARVVVAGSPLRPGETRPARIVLDEPTVVARAGDRFVLRRASPAATIGGGVVTDPLPAARRLRAFPAVGLGPLDRLVLIAAEGRSSGIPASAIPIRVGVTPSDARVLVASTPALQRIADDVVARAALDDAANRVIQMIDAHHKARPHESGAPLDAARDVCRAPVHVTAHVLADLETRGAVAIDGALIRRANWRAASDEKTDAHRDALLARLVAVRAEIPSVAELAREFGDGVMPMLRQLERAGSVVALNSDRFASAVVARELWERVSPQLSPATGYRAADLRPVFGLTRQYLIAWLEYFDRVGHSRREGDLRWFRGGTAGARAR